MYPSKRPPILCLPVLALALVGACDDLPPSEGSCMAPDPWAEQEQAALDYEASEDFNPETHAQMLQELGFCEYGPGQMDEVFPGLNQDEFDIVRICDPESCDACVADELDENLRARYLQKQRNQGCEESTIGISEYARGCFGAYELAGESMCCYSAAIVSDCLVD